MAATVIGIILAVLIALIPAKIAHSRGKNFIVWWIYGMIVMPIAIPHALLLLLKKK